MLTFNDLTKNDLESLDNFYKRCNFDPVNYSVKAKLQQLEKRAIKWCVSNGCLIVQNIVEDKLLYDFPVKGSDGNIDAALSEIELYSYEQGCFPAFIFVPDTETGYLLNRYRYVHIEDFPLLNSSVFFPVSDIYECLSFIPSITTDRLTLNEIKKADIPDYNRLVLDKERNKWWGYDDLGSLEEPFTDESFYNVAKSDWKARLAINFAIRLNGKMIGEAVLYHFDLKGGAELGARVSREYSGKGYGTEAFQAVCSWALHDLRMLKVVAKCYNENAASYKMLSSCMENTGSDETFYYFETQKTTQ